MAHFEIVTNRFLMATTDSLVVTVWKCQNVPVMNNAHITAIWIC